MLINKYLLAAITFGEQAEVANISMDSKNDVILFNFKTEDLYEYPKGVGSTHNLNKYTAAFTIKEWSLKNGYEIKSGGLSCDGKFMIDVFIEDEVGVHGRTTYLRSFFAEDELSGVYEAGEWIFKKIKKDSNKDV